MDIKQLLKDMTLAQKAAQLTQFAAYVLDNTGIEQTGPMQALNVTHEDLHTVGSIFNLNTPEARKAMQEAHMAEDPNHIPMIIMQDVIHGFRTIYPIPLGMAASFDPALVEECAAMAAREAAAFGIDVTFSPMVDLSRDARWGRVMEGAGEDKHLGCVMAQAQVKGYLSEGLQACVKHYAAYGAGEAGRDYNTVDMSETQLRERYLPPYKAAIDAGARFIMPSFNALNGVPSTGNKLLMQQILRKEWGFDGMVVSDYSAVGELMNHGIAEDEADAARLAIEAGCDMEMMTTCFIHSLEKLVADGRITMAQIDERVETVLRMKQELGLFDAPEGHGDPERYRALEVCPEHRAIARKAAERTAVLLKNDGLLPLTDTAKKVAVIGPFADDPGLLGFWSINGRAEETTTILQGIRERLPGAEVRICAGCPADLVTDDESGLQEAVELADWADQVILVLGESGDSSGEGNSRAILELSQAQLALTKLVTAHCNSTAVVLLCGRPLAIPAVDKAAKAILCMWQPGMEGGHAAAALLYGDVAPCGHLPMTFPYVTGQCPISYDTYITARPVSDYTHPEARPYCSRYQDAPVGPLYPFGHGLTYTDFTLTEAKLSAETMTADNAVTASAVLRNTGSRTGTALVQLYTHDVHGSMIRPVRELKDFARVTLAPGEEKTVSFTICEEMLRFETLDQGFASEKGAFEAIIALDSVSGEKLSFRLV